jgi:hypothetical protein
MRQQLVPFDHRVSGDDGELARHCVYLSMLTRVVAVAAEERAQPRANLVPSREKILVGRFEETSHV